MNTQIGLAGTVEIKKRDGTTVKLNLSSKPKGTGDINGNTQSLNNNSKSNR